MGTVEPIRDLCKIKEISDSLNPMYKLIWEIGIGIGLRISDILLLNVDIVGKSSYLLKEKKTGKYKSFPISESLQDHINFYFENYRKKINKYRTEDDIKALFVSRKHCRCSEVSVWREINKVCKQHGINNNVGTHTMRKTFGYHHYKQFKDVAMLQKIFNHSSQTVTLRYIGIEQEEIDSSYKKFNYDYDNNIKIDCNSGILDTMGIANYIDTKFEEINNALIETLSYIQKKQNEKLDKILKNLQY